jgi:DNA polymerase-1
MAKSKAPATTPADGENKPIRHLYLIDGSGYLFRAYHALPPMNRPDGTPINAVFGFCRMLVADLLDNPEIDHIAMILDAGSVTFRNKTLRPSTRQNRPPAAGRPDAAVRADPRGRRAPSTCTVHRELEGFEADDLIATYATPGGWSARRHGCTIVSSDKDLMQLVATRHRADGHDQEDQGDGPDAVFEKFGVGPGARWSTCRRSRATRPTTCRARTGHRHQDRGATHQRVRQSRNTAGAHQARSSSPSGARSLENNAELIRISKQLVSLRDDVPAPADPDSFDKRKPDPNVLLPWLEQQGFRTLLQRFTGELGEATAPVAPPSGPAPMKKADPEGQIPIRAGAGAAEAAAGGPRRPEGRAEPQIRPLVCAPAGIDVRALRRHHADVLCARCGPARRTAWTR